MSSRISQADLERALRSHFAGRRDLPEPPSLAAGLRMLPQPVRRKPIRVAYALAAAVAVSAVVGAAVGVPLVVVHDTAATPEPTGDRIETATPEPSPSVSGEPTPELSPEPTGSPALGEDWWRWVKVAYTGRLKAQVRDYVTVETPEPARCGRMVVSYGSGFADSSLGGFEEWRDDIRDFFAAPETFAGVATARMTCWRDGPNAGPSHDWKLSIIVDPADPWSITAWAVMNPDGRTGTIHARTDRPMLECRAQLEWQGVADPAVMGLGQQPGEGPTFEGSWSFRMPLAAPATTVTYRVYCDDGQGVTHEATGTFEIAPAPTPIAPTPTPTPTAAPTPTP